MTDPREDALATFWLIEWPADDHTPLRWFCGGKLNHSLDWNKAVRFVRKQDAEAAIAWMRFGGGAAAVEHGHVSTDGELTRQSEGGVSVHHHPDNDQSSWAVQAIVRAASKKLSAAPSPTPYVRPAAEIQAEIERANRFIDSEFRRGWLTALTFALTPPTREPR